MSNGGIHDIEAQALSILIQPDGERRPTLASNLITMLFVLSIKVASSRSTSVPQVLKCQDKTKKKLSCSFVLDRPARNQKNDRFFSVLGSSIWGMKSDVNQTSDLCAYL